MKRVLQILSYPLIWLIRIYQLVISPWLGPKCRFTPSCSVYAVEALKKYGCIKRRLDGTSDGFPVVIPGVGTGMIRLSKLKA